MASYGSVFSGREQATFTKTTSAEHPTASDSESPARSAQSSVDSKTAHILSFLTPLIAAHFGTSDLTSALTSPKAPFFLGLNGIQGAGKTTLVRTLADKLRNVPYSLPTAVLSIDDLYLPHTEQKSLAKSHPNNALIQHRGQPGTHDVQLGVQLFENLKAGGKTNVPAYDKSAFNGEGDRLPEMEWETVNDATNEQKLKVVIFEGWCVGFRPLEKSQVVDKWRAATEARKTGSYNGRLGFNELSNVEFINGSLRDYDQLTDSLDALVHIDAANTLWVYDWRLEQEQAMIREKGSGMTAEQVKAFVDGYYPAYELFYDKLRQGVFQKPGKQLRMIIGKDREALEVVEL